jgi:hypothetical protein
VGIDTGVTRIEQDGQILSAALDRKPGDPVRNAVVRLFPPMPDSTLVKALQAHEEMSRTLARTYEILDALPIDERISFALRVIEEMDLTENCGDYRGVAGDRKEEDRSSAGTLLEPGSSRSIAPRTRTAREPRGGAMSRSERFWEGVRDEQDRIGEQAGYLAEAKARGAIGKRPRRDYRWWGLVAAVPVVAAAALWAVLWRSRVTSDLAFTAPDGQVGHLGAWIAASPEGSQVVSWQEAQSRSHGQAGSPGPTPVTNRSVCDNLRT